MSLEEAEDFILIFKELRARLDRVSRLEGDLLRDLIEAVRSLLNSRLNC